MTILHICWQRQKILFLVWIFCAQATLKLSILNSPPANKMEHMKTKLTEMHTWCPMSMYDLRSLFKIRARDWSKSFVCFRYLATTSRLSVLLTITHEKCALLTMARSKASRKLYLQVDKANKFKKISMNSSIKIKKKNHLENFYRQR